MNIEHFLLNTSPNWMMEQTELDIIISTRIRLARNLVDCPFPISFSEQEAKKVEENLMNTLLSQPDEHHQFSYFSMAELSVLQKQLLVEKHLISPTLAKKDIGSSVFLTHDESVSIMVNEEDHIRIQCLSSGLKLMETYMQARKIDEILQRQMPIAFHEKYGYLTSCPTNVGTGLRASVMLHLPALTMSKQMPLLIQMMTRLGMVVRGIYGEGSENLGNVYQVSNQVTLGKTEEEILQELQDVVEQVIEKEKLARKQLLTHSPIILEDRLSRSLGTLKFAKVLTSEEAAVCLSNVRLGIQLGLLPKIDQKILSECMLLIQPGVVQQYAGATLHPAERDYYRAKLLQERLQSIDDVV